MKKKKVVYVSYSGSQRGKHTHKPKMHFMHSLEDALTEQGYEVIVTPHEPRAEDIANEMLSADFCLLFIDVPCPELSMELLVAMSKKVKSTFLFHRDSLLTNMLTEINLLEKASSYITVADIVVAANILESRK